MPTYEYKCLDCDARFETFQNMSDAPLTTCKTCKGRLKRLIGAGAGFIFKGSGFYSTDYRSDSYKKDAKKDKDTSSSSSSSSSSSTGSDSKKKSETKSKPDTKSVK